MEIEFKEGNRSRRVLLIVGVVLAFGTAVAVFALTSGAQPAQAQQATKSVVVATADIDARTVISADMVALRDLPDDSSIDHAYTDPSLLVGRSTGTIIYANQPITPNLLAATEAGSLFSVLGPDETIGPDTPDWRAVSLDVPDAQAVGGMLVVGQHVDVEVSTQVGVGSTSSSDQGGGSTGTGDMMAVVPVAAGASPPPGVSTDCWLTPYGVATTDTTVARYCTTSQLFESAESSKITFQDVEILARDTTHYVVRVDAKDGELIGHLQATSSIFTLLLRGDGDSRALDPANYGETTNLYIEDYGLPIPEEYPRPNPSASAAPTP